MSQYFWEQGLAAGVNVRVWQAVDCIRSYAAGQDFPKEGCADREVDQGPSICTIHGSER